MWKHCILEERVDVHGGKKAGLLAVHSSVHGLIGAVFSSSSQPWPTLTMRRGTRASRSLMNPRREFPSLRPKESGNSTALGVRTRLPTLCKLVFFVHPHPLLSAPHSNSLSYGVDLVPAAGLADEVHAVMQKFRQVLPLYPRLFLDVFVCYLPTLPRPSFPA
jgi:hypothetical protein